MKRILLVAYLFPPFAGPEAFVGARALANLDGCQVDVITLDPVSNELPTDTSLNDYVSSSYKGITRITRPPLLGSLPKPVRQRIMRYMEKYLAWPHFKHINRRVLRKALRQDLSRYDLLMTRSQWHAAQLVGLAIKQRHPELPWLAHFSDPWADSPLIPKGTTPRALAFNKKRERQVISAADGVCFTSPETIELVMKKYPPEWRNKTFYIPHCYDERLYNPSAALKDGHYLFCFTGMMYGGRSPEPLFQAIEKTAAEHPQLLDDVQFHFYGKMYHYSSMLKQRYPAARRLVHEHSVIPYAESLAHMQSAHCILIIDAPLDFSVFFPSKLVDAIGSQRFIFGISPPGATQRILRELGGLVADPRDTGAVTAALQQVLRERPSRLSSDADRYSRPVVQAELLKVLHAFSRGVHQ